MTLSFAPLPHELSSEDHFKPREAPICPALPEEAEALLSKKAKEHALVIQKITKIWKDNGIQDFSVQMPQVQLPATIQVSQTELNYELARRICSILIRDGALIRLRHYAAHLNIAEMQSSSSTQSARLSTAEKLARELVEDTYNAANGDKRKMSSRLVYAVNSYMVDLTSTLYDREDDCQLLVQPALRVLHEATWGFVRKLAPEILDPRPNCIWRIDRQSLEVLMVPDRVSFLTRFKLSHSGWHCVEQLLPKRFYCC